MYVRNRAIMTKILPHHTPPSPKIKKEHMLSRNNHRDSKTIKNNHVCSPFSETKKQQYVNPHQ